MIVYTKTICPKCLFVKAELKRAGVEVEEINIDGDPEAREKVFNAGFTTVPIFDINGRLTNDLKEVLSIHKRRGD